MKQLLFLSFLIAPLFAVAQKIEVGVDAGMGRQIDINSGQVFYGPQFSAVAHAAYNINRHWQIGAGLQEDIVKVSDYVQGPFNTPRYFITSESPATNYTPYIFANRKVYTGKSYFYSGVKVGMVLGHDRRYDYNETFPEPTATGVGVMAGIQAGYNIYLSHHFSINTVLAAAYYNVSYLEQGSGPARNDLLLNVMAGVKYSF